jgi:hypothetical protein
MLNGVNKEVISFLFKGDLPAKLRYRRSGKYAKRKIINWVKTKFQIVKVQIVKLVKHNNDKLLKLLKRYAKDKP